MPFTKSGTQITATLSASAQLAPPGYYMLFVFNTAGVPAVAKIISIGPKGFEGLYPDVKIEIDGKGSRTAPPALVEGASQFGPMPRPILYPLRILSARH